MNNKKIELAKKLKALAERSKAGDGINAAYLLEKLCKEYNIDPSTLEEDTTHNREIPTSDLEHRIFVAQVIASVVGDRPTYRYARKKNSPIIISLSDVEYIEIKVKIDFFWKDYQAQKQVFYQAYIQKQRLYKRQDNNDRAEKSELTEEEIARIKALLQMADAIEYKSHSKLLD